MRKELDRKSRKQSSIESTTSDHNKLEDVDLKGDGSWGPRRSRKQPSIESMASDHTRLEDVDLKGELATQERADGCRSHHHHYTDK